MKSILSAAAVVLFASWTSRVMAGNSQSTSGTGVINFQGSIVESLCDSDVNKTQVNVSCQRNGKTKVSTLALNSTTAQQLPYNIGSSKIHWIDAQRRVGIVTVEYQ